MSRPATGAIAAVGGDVRDDRAAAALRRAAGGSAGAGVREFVDGPLTLAWIESSQIAFAATAAAACLIEGTVYESGGRREPIAAALAAAGDRTAVESRLQALRGDFWLVWWDRRRRHGLAASDQMGAVAPYWTAHAGRVTVASEVADLLAVLPSTPPPDAIALTHWVMSSVAPGGRMLFAGIRRLEAGHLFALGDGRPPTPRRWWSPRYVEPLSAPRDELVTRLREALTTAVARRIDDPVRTAVLLSGGLDSSAVAAFAVAAGHRLSAYSAVFPEHPGVDEAPLIATTTASLRLPGGALAEVRTGSVLGGALAYLDTWQLPPTTPNLFFWVPLLRRAGDEGIRVTLDGEGGDELFGLSPYLVADLLRAGRLRRARALADGWPEPFHASTPDRVRLRLRRFGVEGALPPFAHVLYRRLRGPGHYIPEWLEPRVGAQWLATREATFAWKRLDGPRWWASLLHGVTAGPGPALVYEQARRRAACAGIASRHPLVDVDLIELVLRLPPELAFDSRYSRPLLRDSLAGLLPDDVRLRPHKSSFDTLFHDILAARDLPLAAELLTDPDAELRAFVDLDLLTRALLNPGAPTDPRARQGWAIWLWRLLTAECWLRACADAEWPARFRTRLPSTRNDTLVFRSIDAGPRRG